MRSHILLLALLLTSCKATPRLNPHIPYEVLRESVDIPLTEQLGTIGEITFPDAGSGPHPTVLLLHDGGPQDMDATLDGPAGTTRLFADLSTALSARGFAVIRYNKRHVSGPQKFDLPKFYTDQSTQVFRDDAAQVLDTLAQHPRVDADRIFVYGWSEGSVVAAALATERPTLAGVIVQGPIGEPYRELLAGWFDLAVPYLERFTRDDRIDGIELGLALRSAASEPVLLASKMLAVSYTRHSEVAAPSPMVDINRDGRIDISKELRPRIPDLIDLAFSPVGSLQSYSEDAMLPTVTEQAPKLTGIPVLVLQGLNDAQTPPSNTDRIADALIIAQHPDFEIARFRGLGHTLGRAPDPLDDFGRPMAPEAVETIARWLAAHAK